MKASIYSKEGNKKGELVLNPEIFAARVNKRLLELVHNAYAANLRHGTADTKTRKEVRGGGKKPWRQKGTGRARHGSTRSPIWKGGGVTFGPHPRSYYVNLPKTMRNKALISALSLRGEQKNVLVLEDVKLESPKTKEWADRIKALPLNGKRALCVVRDFETNLKRASQNMSSLVEVFTAANLNAYEVLQREKILIEQEAIPIIEGRLLGLSAKTEETGAAVSEKVVPAAKEAKPKKKTAAKPAKSSATETKKKKS